MFLKNFNAGLEKLNKMSEKLLVVTIVIMFFVLLLQISSRFVFFVPLPWSQDVLTFLLVVSVFFGAGSAVVTKKHIIVDFFVALFPKKIEMVLLMAADVVSILFLGAITYHSSLLGYQAIGVYMGASPVPYNVYYWVVSAGCFVMLMNYLSSLMGKIFYPGEK